MSEVTRASILAQIRALNDRAADVGRTPGQAEPAAFAETLADSLKAVNAMQAESNRLAQEFQTGVNETSLVDVMLASQKAGIAFQAVTEVRNRFVSAYQEIMNMPI